MSEISAGSVNNPTGNWQPIARRALEKLGWIVVIALIGVGLNSVIGRFEFMITALSSSISDPNEEFNAFDVRYYEHYVATFGHLFPALIIVITGPLQFIQAIRNRWRKLHRISGRLFLACGAMGAATGFVIGGLYPFMGMNGPGFNESMATFAITGYTFVCLTKAYLTARQKQFGVHREWVIRSFSIMLGIATERIMLGVLSANTNIAVEVLFGATFWMAAVVHISAAEFWIRLTRTSGNGARHWKVVDASS